MIGRNSLPDLNLSGEDDFGLLCKSLIVNNKHFFAHKCTWYENSLGQRSVIDFVIVSDLKPFVLGKWVKREADQSTNHHLVVRATTRFTF